MMTPEEVIPIKRNFSEKRRILTVYVTGGMCLLVTVGWYLVALWLESAALAYVLIPALVSVIALFALIALGKDLLGRVIWMIGTNLSILGGCFIIARAGRVDLLFLASAIGPIMTFSIRKELKYVVFFAVLSSVFWILTWTFDPNFFGTLVFDDVVAGRLIAPLSTATAVVVTGMEIFYFAAVTLRYSTELNQSNLRLEDAAKTKSIFLATMSHEIRTPMNGVVGMVEVLGTSDLTQDQRRMLDTIRDLSFSLLRIIDDILDMSRIEAGKLQLSPVRCNLSEICEDALKTLAPLADQRQVALSLKISPDIPKTIVADPGRLRQIILNLAGNAIKFSTRPVGANFGVVRFIVSIEDGYKIRLDFIDEGIGMSPELKQCLFKPFSQGDTDLSRNANGTGLGLAIVKQLVDRMNGTIEVDSVLGEGSHFTVRLPIVDGDDSLRDQSLAGQSIVGIATAKMHRDIWQSYIEAHGGKVEWVDTEDELIERFRTELADTFALIGKLDKKFQYDLEAVRKFQKAHPDRRTVTISKDRMQSYGHVEPNRYNVECSPLLPSALWRALDTMANHTDNHIPTDATAEAIKELAAPEIATNDMPATGLRILVAEDNPVNRSVIQLQLEKLGHTPTLAIDGKEALALWESSPFDLLLTDCHMPVLDGFGLSEKIRAEEQANGRDRMPIIAITANALSGEAERCYAAGMDGFLAKPVRMDELRKSLSKWQEAATPKAAPTP